MLTRPGLIWQIVILATVSLPRNSSTPSPTLRVILIRLIPSVYLYWPSQPMPLSVSLPMLSGLAMQLHQMPRKQSILLALSSIRRGFG